MKVIAHRGYSSTFPENTMIAFERAVFHNAPMIELDVTLTQDQQIVVIHDETLDRTTNGQGLVSSMSWREMKLLDAGSWFDGKFADQKVPKLSEVLSNFSHDVALNIEIKKEAVSLDEDLSIEPKLIDLLEDFPNAMSIQVSSFEPIALHRLRRLNPSLPLCYLTEDKLSDEQRQEMHYLECLAQHMSIEAVDEDEVQKAHEDGIIIRAYTVNTKQHFEKAKRLKLDAIFSDFLESELV